jgi:hypothetical protein
MSAVASAQLRELKYKLGKFSVLKDLPGPEYWAAKSRSDLTLAVREQMPATRPFEAKLAALQSKFNSLTSKVRGYTDNAFVASSSSSSSFAAAGSATMATAEATSRCKPDINTTQGIDDTTVLAHPSSSSSSVSQPALSSSSSSSSSSAAAAAAAGPSVFHTYAKPRSKRVPRKKNAAVRPPAAIVGASRKKKSSRAKANLRKQSKPQTHARTHTQPEPNAIPASVDSSVIAVAHAAQREREGLAAKIEALEHKVQENRALKQLNALEVEAKADAKLQVRVYVYVCMHTTCMRYTHFIYLLECHAWTYLHALIYMYTHTHTRRLDCTTSSDSWKWRMKARPSCCKRSSTAKRR